MVQILLEVGRGPAAGAASELIDRPAPSSLLLSWAPAFSRMRRVLGRKRLMREASESDSDSEDSVRGHTGRVIKKFPRRLSTSKSGDYSSATQDAAEAVVESADVEYIKTERVVLTQTLLTLWCAEWLSCVCVNTGTWEIQIGLRGGLLSRE